DVWGFSLNSILQACRETAKVQSPNFAYLDKVLENMYGRGLKTPQQIRTYQSSRKSVNHLIREILYNLGQSNVTATPEHQELYVKWTEKWQIEHSVILIACKQCVRNKTNTFEDLDVLLQKWLDYDLRTYADIKAYIDRKRK